MNDQIARHYLDDVLESFRSYKKLTEKAFAQVSDAELFHVLDQESNSIAVIIKHMAGNLRSRWTDFLTSDGEKPNRERDSEFVTLESETRENLLEGWEIGWQCVLTTIESLQPADLLKTVQIRGENYTVIKAINRALTHAAYHTGQITFLAKHLRANEWQTLSVPRNRSAEFNAYLGRKKAGGESNRLNHLETAQDFAARNNGQ